MRKNMMMKAASAALLGTMLLGMNAFAQEAVTEEAVTEADEAQEVVALADWAYGFALNSEDAGIGTIYYTKAYFETEGRVNPATAQAYTEDEVQAVEAGAVVGAADYIGIVPTDAIVGIGVYGGAQIFWYDEAASDAIISHADPLALTEDGTLVTAEGEEAAAPIPALSDWAYGAITLGSEDLGIGTVYYAENYFETEGRVNPVTVAPYTEAEIAQIKAAAIEGSEAYVADIPENAVIGISANGTDEIVWFDSEASEAFVASADPFVLDAENGQLVTLEGDVAASAIAE